MRITETLIRRLIREAIEAEAEEQVEAELKLNNQRGARYLAKASEYSKDCQLNHLIDNLELCEQQQATLIEGAEQALQRCKFYQAQLY